MRELYLDCSMGAAGDMLCAALLELCSDREAALSGLNALGIPGIEFSAEDSVKCAIRGTHLKVSFHGQEEQPEDGHHHHRHEHQHHGLHDIRELIDSLPIREKVRADAKAVYELIARAEALVHGCEMDNIHFHELGTMDAVADVTAACYLMDMLGIEHVTVSPVRTGHGQVRCAHGLMPVPAPATARLLEGVPSYAGDIASEMCTPTGAALIKYFARSFGQMPCMSISRSGYGMGKKDFDRPNCVRAVMGESEENIIELCCNVDDMSPEAVGFAIDELLRSGAPDAYYEAIGMKKNRPGLKLVCLCRTEQRDEMVKLIFRHTSTLGIRETLCRRYILKRESGIVTSPYGNVRIKTSSGYGVQRQKAEYDDLARIARQQDMSLEQLRELIEKQ